MTRVRVNEPNRPGTEHRVGGHPRGHASPRPRAAASAATGLVRLASDPQRRSRPPTAEAATRQASSVATGAPRGVRRATSNHVQPSGAATSQVQPGSPSGGERRRPRPRRRAAPPAGPAGLSTGLSTGLSPGSAGRQRRHQRVTKGAISARVASPMPDTSSSSSTARERAVLGAEGQDRLRGDRADAGQLLELGLRGAVDVHHRDRGAEPPAAGAAAAEAATPPGAPAPPPRSARRRPAPGPGSGSPSADTGTGTARGLQRVDDPRPGRQRRDPGAPDLAGDVRPRCCRPGDGRGPGRCRRRGPATARRGRGRLPGTRSDDGDQRRTAVEARPAAGCRGARRPAHHPPGGQRRARPRPAARATRQVRRRQPDPALQRRRQPVVGPAADRGARPTGRWACRPGPGVVTGRVRAEALRSLGRVARRTRPVPGGSGTPPGPDGSRRARRSAAPAVAVPPRRPRSLGGPP